MNKNQNQIHCEKKFKILVLHGPNMNLLGLRSKQIGTKDTLDKLNRAIRRAVRNTEIELKIYQTHDEARAVTIMQRNRNKVHGLLLFPGPWHESGYVIRDTLKLIKIPLVTISFERSKITLFEGIMDIIENDPIPAYLKGLKILMDTIKK